MGPAGSLYIVEQGAARVTRLDTKTGEYNSFGHPGSGGGEFSDPTGIAVGVVANWLYDKLKGRATTLRIDRIEVHLDRGEIEKILVERIERKD